TQIYNRKMRFPKVLKREIAKYFDKMPRKSRRSVRKNIPYCLENFEPPITLYQLIETKTEIHPLRLMQNGSFEPLMLQPSENPQSKLWIF
ncbi:MAG: hypothetical protein ACI3YC_08775, partial [Alloprevotella sp.]